MFELTFTTRKSIIELLDSDASRSIKGLTQELLVFFLSMLTQGYLCTARQPTRRYVVNQNRNASAVSNSLTLKFLSRLHLMDPFMFHDDGGDTENRTCPIESDHDVIKTFEIANELFAANSLRI
jgi:hypothetical protein